MFAAIQEVLRGRAYITPLITRDPAMLFVTRAQQDQRTPGLTLRQGEALQLLAEGRSMKEAADILHVTPRTIAFHKYTMLQQHGLKTGAELVQYAVRLGLVSSPGTSAPRHFSRARTFPSNVSEGADPLISHSRTLSHSYRGFNPVNGGAEDVVAAQLDL